MIAHSDAKPLRDHYEALLAGGMKPGEADDRESCRRGRVGDVEDTGEVRPREDCRAQELLTPAFAREDAASHELEFFFWGEGRGKASVPACDLGCGRRSDNKDMPPHRTEGSDGREGPDGSMVHSLGVHPKPLHGQKEHGLERGLSEASTCERPR